MIVALLALEASTNTLLIALIIPFLGVVSPLLLASQINRNTRKDKQMDWDRQDTVAAEALRQQKEVADEALRQQNAVAERAEQVALVAEQAAQLVVQRQIALDEKTDEVARQVAAQTNAVGTQLEKIHGLVNSQMTAAIRSELGATRDTLALMSEVIATHRKDGVEPSLQVLAAFKGREAKIVELEETLRVREEADAASKLVNVGPREVVIVNPDPVDVTVKDQPTGGSDGQA